MPAAARLELGTHRAGQQWVIGIALSSQTAAPFPVSSDRPPSMKKSLSFDLRTLYSDDFL